MGSFVFTVGWMNRDRCVPDRAKDVEY